MSLFSRQRDAVVTALSWSRTVTVEQGRWEHRRTPWKPGHGATVRNLRTVHVTEADVVGPQGGGGRPWGSQGIGGPDRRSREVVERHTYFEYEELTWHKYRSFSARGDGPDSLRPPEPALTADQRVSGRREAYRATFAAGPGDDDTFTAEVDEATFRALAVGRRCRLRVGMLAGDVRQVTPVVRDGHRPR
jgi:hypothetical protein